ncbi:TraR/DksA family transcriptional regulator [Rhodovulum sp. YNF3179]|uniref:TraR/DksA family transcriptional regulator n=1 Tax=Rhodovulum sp. YNF3179 TaxID=3425127 RepID=UPI003D33C480
MTTPLHVRREQLAARMAELDEHLHEIEEELDATPNADAEERATEREGDEVLEGMGLSGLRELRMIQAAIARIDDGSYGTCTKCGDPISEERLDLIPYTPFCRNCAR